MRSILLSIIFLALQAALQAQIEAGVPMRSNVYDQLERVQVLTGKYGAEHPELKFWSRKDLADHAQSLDSLSPYLDKTTQENLSDIANDNSEFIDPAIKLLDPPKRGIFGWFYKTPAHFFEVSTPALRLRINPIIDIALGSQKGDPELLFTNRRGIEVRGDIDRRVFFSSTIIENQERLPNYLTDLEIQKKIVPGAGVYKYYRGSIFNLTQSYDYWLANAYMGFKISKHVGLQLGHGNHFLGNGYRSLFLSDFGANTFFLKLNTRVWRFNYQNLFMELSPVSYLNNPGGGILPKKYVAAHYLNYKLTPRLSAGIFEATVLNRSRQFEFQYLNPVILYRTVEASLGSPDNVLVGFDARWDVFKRVRLYGQFILDEFLFSALTKPEQKGWWGNKFGVQTGIKYFNAFGVKHLDIQGEYNLVRPYTYSHFDSLNSYTHYGQPLAHPLGSNFKEVIAIVRYQPSHRWTMAARLIHIKTGDNTLTENWGTDPLLSNKVIPRDYGNVVGQGTAAQITLAGLDVSWQFYHNMFLDLKYLNRRKNSDKDDLDLNTNLISGGVRINFWHQNRDL